MTETPEAPEAQTVELDDDDDTERCLPYSQVKVLDFRPSGMAGEYSQEAWKVQVGEDIYWYEVWITSYGGGAEWYDADYAERVTGPEALITDATISTWNPDAQEWALAQVDEIELDDVISDLCRRASTAYFALHEERVAPVITAVKEEVFPFNDAPA